METNNQTTSHADVAQAQLGQLHLVALDSVGMNELDHKREQDLSGLSLDSGGWRHGSLLDARQMRFSRLVQRLGRSQLTKPI